MTGDLRNEDLIKCNSPALSLGAPVYTQLQDSGWKGLPHLTLALILNPSPLGRRTLNLAPLLRREKGLGDEGDRM